MFDLAGGFALAALPAIPILIWLRRNDRARPEPIGLVGKGLLLGFLSVMPAAVLEYLLFPFIAPSGGLGARFFEAFIVAALVEEGLKFAFLRRWLWRESAFDEAADGIVYAVSVSLGFAIIENFIYTWHRPEVLIVRSLTAVPLHALATGQLGYWLGVEKLREKRKSVLGPAGTAGSLPRGAWPRGLAEAVFVHGAYDFFLFGADLAALLIVPLLIVAFFILRSRFALARRFDEAAVFDVDSLEEGSR